MLQAKHNEYQKTYTNDFVQNAGTKILEQFIVW
jgi:hypothetical protein